MAFNSSFDANKQGNTPAPASGFAFGGSAPAPAGGTGGIFNFSGGANANSDTSSSTTGAGSGTTSSGGGAAAAFAFNAPASGGAPAPAFSFGGSTTSGESKTPSFAAGGGAPAAGGGFSFSNSAAFGGETKTTTDSSKPVPNFGSTTAPAPAGEAGLFGAAKPTGGDDAAGKANFFGAATFGGVSADSSSKTSGFSLGGKAGESGGKAPAPAMGGVFGTGGFGSAPAADANTKAPAPGGTSFGSTPAPAPANSGSKTPAPAPAGFSFGGTPAPAATPAPAPAFGGFSSASKPTGDKKTTPPPTTPAGVQTPATPTPVQTPATPAPAQTPASTTTTAAPMPKPKEPAPVEYQTLTVEQVINKFQQELEKDALKFLKEADRVTHYDAILRDSQRSLSNLAGEMSRMFVQQKELDNVLTGLGAFDNELEGNLETLETQVQEMFAAQAHVPPQDADIERERAYSLAATLERRLTGLTDQLNATLKQLEASQERAFGQGDEGAIVRILNQHQNALAQLETKSRSMESDIAEVSRVLSSSTR